VVYGCEHGVRDAGVLVDFHLWYSYLSPPIVVVIVVSCYGRRPLAVRFKVASLIIEFVSWVDKGEMGEHRPGHLS